MALFFSIYAVKRMKFSRKISPSPYSPFHVFLNSFQASLTVLLLTMSLESWALSDVQCFLNVRMFLFSP